jgi:hypothetical protein
MPHPVIYRGDLEALLTEADSGTVPVYDNGECARLVQLLCSEVGFTGRWQRGERVMDSPHLAPGTVVANFKFVDGKWKYPNERGHHTGIFLRFGGKPANGGPAEFTILDQYRGKLPGDSAKSVLSASFKAHKAWLDKPTNRADEYYVVLVP